MVQTQLPVIFDYQNGQLNSKHAMPQKDITSDGTADFSRNRRFFWRFLGNPSLSVTPTSTTSQMRSTIDGQPRLAQLNANVQQKKWGNTNRDASQIAARKRVLAIGDGTVNDTNKTLSFTTTRSINTEYDAIVRCRAGGYCVPKKVTQKYLANTFLYYYRVISAGWNSLSTHPTPSPGFYNYSINDLPQTLVFSKSRSYNLIIISRQNGKVIFNRSYDVFFDSAGNSFYYSNDLNAKLNSLDNTVFVLIYSYDDAKGNADKIETALKRCGASSTFPTQINYRGAYVLLGIPGIGTGNGIERYVGQNLLPNGDPNAWIDFRFSVDNLKYTYISG